MEEKKFLADLMANMHNLEISVMAIGARLSLVETFNIQLTQGQIDMKAVLTELMKGGQQSHGQEDLRQVVSELAQTVNQMKTTQNMLMIRLKASAT